MFYCSSPKNISFAWFYLHASSLEVLALYILIKKHFTILQNFISMMSSYNSLISLIDSGIFEFIDKDWEKWVNEAV